MGLDNINPMANVYKDFVKILNNMTIKYSYLAEKYETLETKQNADAYIEAKNKNDSFFTYHNYTMQDLDAVEIYDYTLREEILSDNLKNVPLDKQEKLVELKRNQVIANFEEQNNYYRLINGYPPIETKPTDYHYITSKIAESYGIDRSIPIHKLQDYYNLQKSGEGDRIINLIDGLGIIRQLRKNFPEEEYLNYIGSDRIDIIKARQAKNFEILKLNRVTIKNNIFDAFLDMYDKCREYFCCTIYNSQFRTFFDYYDNFMAMCIMLMTTQQLIMKQIPYEVERNFFDIYGVQMLYNAYNVPYDLDIDEETQNAIVQNLNLFINHKATNKVIYDIAKILGFPNLKAYKYYLAKEHKFDIYGAPIFQYKEQFNNDTGEYEIIPDYEAMYDMYFQKEELNEDDFIQSFNSKVNKVDYEEITTGDPFWWEDQNLYQRKWEVDYNFVETKYLSLGLSYSMTSVIFENILLLKLLMQQRDSIQDITISVPKILDGVNVPIFDLVILLICLVTKRHHLTGEIISIPTQVINVLDYLQNVEGGSEYLVDTFSFDFDYFITDDGIKNIEEIKKYLGEEDANTFVKYIEVLSINSDADVETKIKTLNLIYSNIKNLYQFISFKMSDCADKKLYDSLKTFYQAAFYSKEMKSMFTITGLETGFQRTAKNYFEFLYYYNPKLYSAIFKFEPEQKYQEYLEENPGISLSYSDFMSMVEHGEIDVYYDDLQLDESSGNAKISEDTIYYYVNHIISRFKTIIDNINFLYMVNDSATPLEELLVKLIRFAKSFTVDMIGLDTIYVCDFKLENMIRLIDVPHYINKLIETKDPIRLSHSDTIHRLISNYELNDSIHFEELYTIIKELIIDNPKENHLFTNDEIKYMMKNIQVEDNEFFLIDDYEISSTLHMNDKSGVGLKDGIVKMWYSD